MLRATRLAPAGEKKRCQGPFPQASGRQCGA